MTWLAVAQTHVDLLVPKDRLEIASSPKRSGMLGAMAYYQLDAISWKAKDAIRERILEGKPFTPVERKRILNYCGADVNAMVALLPKMLPGIGRFGARSAPRRIRPRWRGWNSRVPIDPVTYSRLADKHAWAYARDALVPSINKAYRIFVRWRRRLAFRHGTVPGLPRPQRDSLAAHGYGEAFVQATRL